MLTKFTEWTPKTSYWLGDRFGYCAVVRQCTDGSWMWEVLDGASIGDCRIKGGFVDDLDEAKRCAEEVLEKLRLGARLFDLRSEDEV